MYRPITLSAAESRRLDDLIATYRDIAIECEESPAARDRLRAPRRRAAIRLIGELDNLGFVDGSAAQLDGFVCWIDSDEDGTARLYHLWVAPRHVFASEG